MSQVEEKYYTQDLGSLVVSEEDIKEIVKFRWMIAGSGVVVAIIITTVTTLASGWWDPIENHHQSQPQQLAK